MRGSRPANHIRPTPVSEETMKTLFAPNPESQKEALDEFGITYIEIERESIWRKIVNKIKEVIKW